MKFTLATGAAIVAMASTILVGAVAAASPTIKIVDFAFEPASTTILAGDAVTWQNTTGTAHTVTADDGSFDSGQLGLDDQFANVFTAPGRYLYHCTIHPAMTGVVIVNAAKPTVTPKGTLPPTPPAGTLPPDFNTPVPVPTAEPTPAPSVSAAAPGETASAGPTVTPPPGSDGPSGGNSAWLAVLGAIVVAGVVIAYVAARRRRQAGG